MEKTKSPSILYLDIESTLNIAGVWGVGKVHLTFENILKERQVSIVGYAWNDEKVQELHFDLNKYSYTKYDDDADKALLQKVSKLIEQADLIVAHNGKYFDVSVMRSRLIKHKLPDFMPTLIDDSYEKIKPIGFNSHKLDYLGKYLGEGRKTEHGFDLWVGIINKDRKSLDKQIKYCMQDVELLRKVYKRIVPYMKSSLNHAVFSGEAEVCPQCGNKDCIRRGYKYSRLGKFVQFQCRNCGTYHTSGTNLIKNTRTYNR